MYNYTMPIYIFTDYILCSVNESAMYNLFSYFNTKILFLCRWKTVSQSECSAQCGPGTRTQSVVCVQEYEKRAPSQISDTMCSHLPKPANTIPCDGKCLESRWSFTEWTPVR